MLGSRPSIDWTSQKTCLKKGKRAGEKSMRAIFPFCIGYKKDSLSSEQLETLIQDLTDESKVSPQLSFEIILHENPVDPDAVTKRKSENASLLKSPKLKDFRILIISIDEWREKYQEAWNVAKIYFDEKFSLSLDGKENAFGIEMQTNLTKLAETYLKVGENRDAIQRHLSANLEIKEECSKEYYAVFPKCQNDNNNVDDAVLAYSYCHVKYELIDALAYAQIKTKQANPTQYTKIFSHEDIPDAYKTLVRALKEEDPAHATYFCQTISVEKYNWKPLANNKSLQVYLKSREELIKKIQEKNNNPADSLEQDPISPKIEVLRESKPAKVTIGLDVVSLASKTDPDTSSNVQRWLVDFTTKLAERGKNVYLDLRPSSNPSPIWESPPPSSLSPSPDPEQMLPSSSFAVLSKNPG